MLPEATMAQRISRAKKRLSTLDRPFARPGDAEWRERLGSVLHVLYLIFSEGHTTTSGPDLHRADLSTEAIRLARSIHGLLPDDTEVTGLLALMLLTDSRRGARTGTHGELIPLAEQNRALWDRVAITEGLRLTTSTLAQGLCGPYQLQAAIAVLHAKAIRAEETEWGRVLALYDMFERMAPNPMVTLNRAIATAMVHGPAAGLELADTLDGQLVGNHRLDAVRGHLHEMAGDVDAAIASYTTAAGRTTSTPERDYLTIRAARLRTAARD
jgi:predicted RNA polymerase sigma factor